MLAPGPAVPVFVVVSIEYTHGCPATVFTQLPPGANTYTDKASSNTNVGTSFSSPIVSGVAGLMLSVNGNLKSKQLIARMKQSANPFPTTSDSAGVPNCQDPRTAGTQPVECICNNAVCGAGMVNALGAVQAALRPIAAASFPASYAAGSSITLDASGSTAACKHNVMSYSWTVSGNVISTASTATLSAPANGAAATTVRVTVTDDAGLTDFADITVNPTSAQSTAPTSAGSNACLADVNLNAAVTVAIIASDSSASETGADTGTFIVSRTGDGAAALTVPLVYSGTATSGSDYAALPATVTIPAGSFSVNVVVTPIDDSTVEGAETVIATAQGGTGYVVGSPSSATVTIADNDTAAAPPPSSGGSSGKGGGGAFDPLTLLGALGFAVFVALRRLGVGALNRRAAEIKRLRLRG